MEKDFQSAVFDMMIVCWHVISNKLSRSENLNGSTSIACISSLAETLIEH